MSKSPLYIFLHLHKCGGSTLVGQLRENFRPEEIVSLYYFEDDKMTHRDAIKKKLLSLPSKQRVKLKVIFGHEAYYGLHKLFPDREVRYITFIRSPQTRIVSHYNFYRTQFESGIMRDYLKPEIYRDGAILTFRNWLSKTERYHNFIFRHFYSHFFNEKLFEGGKEVQIREEGLDQIKKILDRFYFVGLTERREDFFFIYRQLGFKRFLPDQNISRKYFKLEDHPEDLPLVTNSNHFDQSIYDYGVRLNQCFKKNHPFFYLETTWIGLIRRLYFGYDHFLVRIYDGSTKLKKISPTYVKLINRIKGVKTII